MHVSEKPQGEFMRDILVPPASTAESRASVEMQVVAAQLPELDP